MELSDIMRERRSIRRYADKPIPVEMLDNILQAAALAPTSRNRKPCTVYLVTERERLCALSHAKQSGAAFAEQAGAAAVIAADSEKADTWIEDSSIAMTYMMLSAQAQGLGCCWVQIHMRQDANGRDAEENVRRILGLPERFRIVGFLSLGVMA